MNTLTKDQKERFEKEFKCNCSDTCVSFWSDDSLIEVEQFIADELALAVKNERDRIVKALDVEINRVKNLYADDYIEGLEKAKSIVEGVK